MTKYKLYYDGIASDKVGSFCCIITKDDKKIGQEIGCTDKEVTANRMKLLAILIGIRMLPDNSSVTIITDDEYSVKAALSINKRQYNLDILNMIDNERNRMRKVDYNWIDSNVDIDKKLKAYCSSVAQEGIKSKSFINVLNYFPKKCATSQEEENLKEEMERKEKINGIIDNVVQELYELKKLI